MKDERIYLRHIVEAIEDIESYTKSGYKTFTLERMRQDAVIRKLEVIGEAVKQLSTATKAARAEIQWREIAAMRDKMIHEYFGVNIEIVWEAVEKFSVGGKSAIGDKPMTMRVEIGPISSESLKGKDAAWADVLAAE